MGDPDIYARVVFSTQTFTRASFRPKQLRARRFDPRIYARVVLAQTFARASFRPKQLRARRFDPNIYDARRKCASRPRGPSVQGVAGVRPGVPGKMRNENEKTKNENKMKQNEKMKNSPQNEIMKMKSENYFWPK